MVGGTVVGGTVAGSVVAGGSVVGVVLSVGKVERCVSSRVASTALPPRVPGKVNMTASSRAMALIRVFMEKPHFYNIFAHYTHLLRKSQ